ncbi:MAG: hypothetical protein RIR37_373 [Verrucomicrobiota bacterium]
MKTHPSPRFIATLLACIAAIGTGVATAQQTTASRIPATPDGLLNAYPSVVQTGTKPTLSWNILHPSKVSDLVEVDPPGTLIAISDVYASVQIVGSNAGTVSNEAGTPTNLPTDARLSFNDGGYSQIFYGTQSDIDPVKQLYIKKMRPGDTLDFGGRFVQNGNWTPFYTSRSTNFQVVSLTHGQTPPVGFDLSQSSSLNNFLRPYLDATGKVNIGPLSVLVLMELGTNDRNTHDFDLQDQVLLVTFSKKHPNNGHGNNLDGVDASNPGQGSGGPNGAVDPSGGVDDEAR